MMKRITYIFIAFIAFHGVLAEKPALELSSLKLGVSVQNEAGENIEGGRIQVRFNSFSPREGALSVIQSKNSSGGEISFFQGRALSTETLVEKEGYWQTMVVDKWPEAIDKDMGWYFPETKKEIVVIVRRIINPRQLYVHLARNVRLHEFDHKYGYDLERGDLVRPHGTGRRADMFFTMTGEYNNETREFHVKTTISFTNEGDGIFPVERNMLGESKLLLGQEAPADGYLPTFEMRVTYQREGRFLTRTRSPSNEERAKWEGLWFRTHSKIDDDTGQIIKARYGKIYSPLEFIIMFGFGLETPVREMYWNMEFIYFYSPDHSRSLEFDGNTLVPNGNLQGVRRR